MHPPGKTMVRKYDLTVGPNVTRKDLQPTYRWKAQRDRCSTFGKTKRILMSRLCIQTRIHHH